MEGVENQIISFKDYMRKALYSEKGYYMKKEFITGEEGDFITPSNFSLPLAICIKNFIKIRRKEFKNPVLIEVGGGEGIFAFNFIKTGKEIDYYFYEPSPSLRLRAKKRLKDKVIYLNSLDKLQNIEGFFIFIEVFDAFPFRRIIKKGDDFYEIFVNLADKNEILKRYEDKFLEIFKEKIPEDIIFEYSDEIISFLKVIKGKIEKAYLIVIDYIEEFKEIMKKKKGTARTFKKHNVSDELYEETGKRDITRTLNLDFLLKKFEIAGFESVFKGKLYEFLIENSIEEIFEYEKELNHKDRLKLISQLNYLLNPEAMGEIYKVLIFKGSNP